MVKEEYWTDAAAAGIDMDKLAALEDRAGREVREGLLKAAQIAVARNGQLLWQKSYGTATDDSLFCIFSATKAVTSAATWILLQEGKLSLDEIVADIIPSFGTNGKEVVTVEQLLTHTAGFPHAPFAPLDWNDPAKRESRFAQWRLSFAPGTQFEYHPTATMWVLAEIIERRTGNDFREFVRTQVLDPLGLNDFFVGFPAELGERVVPCEYVGDPLTSEDYARLGMPEPPQTEVTEEAILRFNQADTRAVGVPGGGGVCGAGELAMLHQGIMLGGLGGNTIWDADWLAKAKTVHSGELKDPMFRKLANRSLGLIISGDEARSFRGFGKTNSPSAFGHNGAGGQLAWADPATGLSLGYVTNGHDRNPIRQGSRGVAISSIAAELIAP